MKKSKVSLYDITNELDDILGDNLNNSFVLVDYINSTLFENELPNTDDFKNNYVLCQTQAHIIWKELLAVKKRLNAVREDIWATYLESKGCRENEHSTNDKNGN